MKRKRRPWPRWAKILRNVLLTVLLVFLMWDTWDRPTVSARAALRKKERQMLCPVSTAAVEVKNIGGPSHWVVQADGLAMVFQTARGDWFTNMSLRAHPLQDRPALYDFNWTTTLPGEAGQPMEYVVYAAFRPPEGCASAVLSLHNGSGDYVVEGQREEDFFLFYVRPNPENGTVIFRAYWFDSEGYTYELAFYNEDGVLLEEVSG